ncbi:MAG: Pyridinium-3,5-bisthiocarboxylic acid mononucleotide nickel insertion protein [Verrucomicrobiales bacterium]|nr:Pyridinium-3,5-bisthiocarboxylic acid mononucleotide nickel insertion protein [Verrucomicrobiales bacterium]
MKTLYLDIFSGISGDMFIGAMLDLGIDFQTLQNELGKLNLPGYHLRMGRAQKSGIEGVKFDVDLKAAHDHGHQHGAPDLLQPFQAHSHGHSHSHGGTPHVHSHDEEHGRNYRTIKDLIFKSALPDWVKQRSVSVFHRVAVAEGKVHGHPPEEVHFHEVGAVDSIVDIVGACIALDMLGRPRVLAAQVVEGTGWVNCAHGRFPVPTAATLEILGARRIALTQCEEPHELVTPTGAALLAEFVESFGHMQHLVAKKIGYGLGTRDNKTRPNVLRAVLGETQVASEKAPSGNDWEIDTIAVLETNLDDINPEILGAFVEKALTSGALDVFHTAIQMKKNRPGVLLTVLCAEADADKFSKLILRETTAFGVRRSLCERRKLLRSFLTVKTAHGDVVVKLGKLNGDIVQMAPEFESCRKLAEAKQLPVKQIYEEAMQAVFAQRKI